jgi:hypothetical protein
MKKFKFAGFIVEGDFVCEAKLNDGTKVYKFKDKHGYIYPVKKEDICGNLKQ